MLEDSLRKVFDEDSDIMCRLLARVVDHYVSYSLLPIERRPLMDEALDEILMMISLEQNAGTDIQTQRP